jgi:hypothetical protein
MKRFYEFSKVRTRRPRCKRVVVILNNSIEIVELIREQIYRPAGDLADRPLDLAGLARVGGSCSGRVRHVCRQASVGAGGDARGPRDGREEEAGFYVSFGPEMGQPYGRDRDRAANTVRRLRKH